MNVKDYSFENREIRIQTIFTYTGDHTKPKNLDR